MKSGQTIRKLLRNSWTIGAKMDLRCFFQNFQFKNSIHYVSNPNSKSDKSDSSNARKSYCSSLQWPTVTSTLRYRTYLKWTKGRLDWKTISNHHIADNKYQSFFVKCLWQRLVKKKRMHFPPQATHFISICHLRRKKICFRVVLKFRDESMCNCNLMFGWHLMHLETLGSIHTKPDLAFSMSKSPNARGWVIASFSHHVHHAFRPRQIREIYSTKP